MTQVSLGRAEACANIALAKYWGKSERGSNLTAVPSLSLTLDALRTRTEVRFDSSLSTDCLRLGGEDVSGRPLERVTELLQRLRRLSSEKRFASVVSENNFPTAAGLASSASGFAALSMAAAQGAGLAQTPGQLSGHARRSSASAARSLFEGFALLGAEKDEAEALLPAAYWEVVMVVAVVSSGPKAIGSTGGMVHTKKTSPFYKSWVSEAPAIYEEIKQGVLMKDFEQVADAMEHSTRLMHATMLTSRPPVLYLKGPTMELMHEIDFLRKSGSPAAYTMDAGPNVKVLTLRSEAPKIARFLNSFPGVESTIVCAPGPGASTLALTGSLKDAARDDNWLPGTLTPASNGHSS